jgi:hypothetical protein
MFKVKDGIRIGAQEFVDGSRNVTAGTVSASDVTISGELKGPATMYIDPAAVGDNTGTLVIRGNLQVDGTTTTINSTTVAIDDLNLQLATDAPNAAAADGAGITIGGASATFTYASSGDKWQLNKSLEINGNQVWHAGNLTNLNQLTNGPGYITGYTETDTLATVTGRGATTSTALTLGGTITVNAPVVIGTPSGTYVTPSSLHVGSKNTGSAVSQLSFESVGAYTGAIAMNSSGNFSWGGQGSSNWYWKINNTYNSDYSATGTTVASLTSGGSFSATGDVRAPIFYDSNNTSYYIDPNGGSQVSGNRFYFGTHGSLYDDGNFHIDGHSSPVWINSLNNSTIELNTQTSGYVNIGNSARAPIFYDSANTSYYVDPNTATSANFYGSVNAATYNLAGLLVNASGSASTGGAIAIQQVTSEGWTGIFTDYEPYTGWGLWHDNPNNYFLITAESDTGNIASNSVPSRSSGNRTAYTKFRFQQGDAIGIAGGSWRAPIFYDSNDTTYYLDPNGKSELNSLDLGYTSGQVYSTAGQGTLFFNNHGESDIQGYSIGTTLENYGGNYTKLTLDWHTGIKIGAWYGYGGIRFYNNSIKYYGGSEVFSIAKGDNNVRVENNLYAPILYDLNDTGYYVDPNSASRLLTIRNSRFEESDGTFVWRVGSGSGTTRHINLSDSNSDPSAVSVNSGITWGERTDNYPYYLIYAKSQYNNGYSNHTRLTLAWHTGIEIGAAPSYGGTRFFNNSPFTGSDIFSVGKGDNHVRVENNLYAPILYDLNNTGYYVDPASTDYSARLAGNLYFTSYPKIGIEDAGMDCYLYITDQNPTIDGIGYGGEFYFYGDKSISSSYLNFGGAIVENILRANSSLRAPIFYDSNDTNYYLDPASSSKVNHLLVNGGNARASYISGTPFNWTGSAAQYFWNRVATLGYEDNIVIEIVAKTDFNYRPMTIAIASFNTWNGTHFSVKLDTINSSDITIDVAFDNSNQCWVRAFVSWNCYLKWRIIHNSGATIYESGVTYQEAQPTNSIVVGTGQQVRGTYGNVTGASVTTGDSHYVSGLTARSDVRAPIFYDSNDTGYYLDPNSTGVALRIAGAIQGNHVAWTGEHNKIQWHSAHMYFQNMSDGYWIFRRSNGSEPFQLHADGWGQASGDWRAPRFYDSNDTNYYVDPNSASNLNTRLSIQGYADSSPNYTYGIQMGGGYAGITAWNFNPNGSSIYRNLTFYSTGWNGSAVVTRDVLTIGNYGAYVGIRENNPNNYLQIGSVGASGYGGNHIAIGDGTYAYAEYLNGSSYMAYYTTSGYFYFANQYLRAEGSMRAPIFIDSNDTNYYLDPNSTSRLDYLRPNRISVVGSQDNGAPRWDFKAYVVESQHHYGQTSTQTMYLGEDNYINIRSIGEASGSLRAPIFYDSNDTSYYVDPNAVGPSAALASSIYLGTQNTDGVSWDYSNGASYRPGIQIRGQYPHIDLIGVINNNNHGPTLRFMGYDNGSSGAYKHWVIGTAGSNVTYLDFGFANSDSNPHAGISGYGGTTLVRMTNDSRVGIGGDWGAYGSDANPLYNLHFVGSNNATNGHAAFFDNRVNATNNGAGFLFRNLYGNHSWGVVAEYRIDGAGDRPSILFSSNQVNTSWSVGFVTGSDDTFRITKNHGHRAYYGGWTGTGDGWGTPYLTINTSGNVTAPVDMRSPIFYDSNDTTYYLDPNSTTSSLKIAGAIELGENHAFPNVEWSSSGTSTGMVIFKLPGGSGNYGMVHMVFDYYEYDSPRTATIIVSGHNWNTGWYNNSCNVVGFIDKQVRLGFKDGQYCVVIGTSGSGWNYGTVRLRKIHNASFYNAQMDLGGSYSVTQTTTESFTNITGDLRNFRTPTALQVDGILYAYTDVRTPVVYDQNDTGYYSDPNSVSQFWRINASNYIYSSNQMYSTIMYDTSDTGYYCDPNGSSRLNDVFPNQIYNYGWFRNQSSAIGLYNTATDSHFYSAGPNYWHINPDNGSVSAGGLIFYDQYNSTQGGETGRRGYVYWDGSGFGLVNGADGDWAVSVHTTNHKRVTIGGNQSLNAYGSKDGIRLMFGGGNEDAAGNYYIGTNFENYGGNYTKLDLRWHTGIRMGAQPGYGGIRFYDNEGLGTVRFSINKGDEHTRVESGSFYSNLMYDRDNTAYYVDPASTSRLLKLRVNTANDPSDNVFGTAADIPLLVAGSTRTQSTFLIENFSNSSLEYPTIVLRRTLPAAANRFGSLLRFADKDTNNNEISAQIYTFNRLTYQDLTVESGGTNDRVILRAGASSNIIVGENYVTHIKAANYSVTTPGALDIDCRQGNYFTKTIAGDSTFTFSNVTSLSGYTLAYSFTLELTHTSGTVTWPASVKWPGNTAPSLTTGKTHLFMFVTDDAGSRWRGSYLTNYDN